jgi:hypothetical protein
MKPKLRAAAGRATMSELRWQHRLVGLVSEGARGCERGTARRGGAGIPGAGCAEQELHQRGQVRPESSVGRQIRRGAGYSQTRVGSRRSLPRQINARSTRRYELAAGRGGRQRADPAGCPRRRWRSSSAPRLGVSYPGATDSTAAMPVTPIQPVRPLLSVPHRPGHRFRAANCGIRSRPKGGPPAACRAHNPPTPQAPPLETGCGAGSRRLLLRRPGTSPCAEPGPAGA